nr:MAG TPA: RNA polymerase [Caudoviricetes sp.]
MSDYKTNRPSALNRTIGDFQRRVVPTGNVYENYAVAKGITVDQARADHLQEVALRKKAELEGVKAKQQQERQLRILAGESPDKVNREVAIAEQNASTMTGAQRLQNIMNGGYDPEFSRDLDNKSPEELGMLYGAEVQAFATQRARNELSAMATTMSNRGEEGSTLGSVVQGAAQGTANLLNTANTLIHQGISAPTEALYDSATTDETYESALQRKRAQGWKGHNEIQDGIDGFFSQFDSEAQANEKKSDMAVGQLAEALRLRNERQYRNETDIDWETARKAAASDADRLDNYGKNISKDKLFTGAGEQLPQLALAYVTGGAGSALLKGAGSAYASRGALSFAEKQVAKLSAGELSKLGSIGASVGIGAEAGAQDFAGAGADAYKAVEELPQEALDKSPNYQKLIQSGLSPKEAREALAVEAADKAGTKSGMITAGSAGALGSIFEKALFGLGGKLTKNNAILGLGSPATEAFSEGLEEYWNNTAPKEAINDVLGYNYHADPSIYSTSAVTQAASISGLVGSAGNVRTTASLAGQAIMGSKPAQYIKNKAEEYVEKRADAKDNGASTIESIATSSANSATKSVMNDILDSFAQNTGRDRASFTSKDYKDFSNYFAQEVAKAKANNDTQRLDELAEVSGKIQEAVKQDITDIIGQKGFADLQNLAAKFAAITDPNIPDSAREQLKKDFTDSLAVAEQANKDIKQYLKLLNSKFIKQINDEDASQAADFDISSVIGSTPKNLSSILFSANKKVKDFIQANPDKASQVFDAWFNTIASKANKASMDTETLNDIKGSVQDMLNALKQSSSMNSAFTQVTVDSVQSFLDSIDDTLSDKESKAVFEKWLDPKKGILSYVVGAENNPNLLDRLATFNQTQIAKVQGLNSLLNSKSVKLDSDGNYVVDQVVHLPNGKVLMQQDGKTKAIFKKPADVQKYLDAVMRDSDDFFAVTKDTFSAFAKNNQTSNNTQSTGSNQSNQSSNTTNNAGSSNTGSSTGSTQSSGTTNNQSNQSNTSSNSNTTNNTSNPSSGSTSNTSSNTNSSGSSNSANTNNNTKGNSNSTSNSNTNTSGSTNSNTGNNQSNQTNSSNTTGSTNLSTNSSTANNSKTNSNKQSKQGGLFEDVEENSEPTIAEDKTKAKKDEKTTSETAQDEQEATSKDKPKETSKTEEKASKTEATAEEKVNTSDGLIKDLEDSGLFIKDSNTVGEVSAQDSNYVFSGGSLGAESIWTAMLNAGKGISADKIANFVAADSENTDQVIGTSIKLPTDFRVKLADSVRNILKDNAESLPKKFIDRVEELVKDFETALTPREIKTANRHLIEALQVIWATSVVAVAPVTGNIQSNVLTTIGLALRKKAPVYVLDTVSADWYQVTGFEKDEKGNWRYQANKIKGGVPSSNLLKNGSVAFTGTQDKLADNKATISRMAEFVQSLTGKSSKVINEALNEALVEAGYTVDEGNYKADEQIKVDVETVVTPVSEVHKDATENFRDEVADKFFEATKGMDNSRDLMVDAYKSGYFIEGDSFLDRYQSGNMNAYTKALEVIADIANASKEDKALAIQELNPQLTEEEATELVEKDSKNVDDILNAVREAYILVENKFATSKLNLDPEHITQLSGVLNFYGKDEEGNYVLPKSFLMATAVGLTDAIAYGLSGRTETNDNTIENSGISSDSVITTRFNPDVINSKKADGTLKIDKATFEERPLERNDLPRLGTDKGTLINELGKFMQKRLGLKFDASTPIDAKKGMTSSLGIELFNLMQEKYLIRDTRVTTGDLSMTLSKMTFSGAPSLHMPHSYDLALRQLIHETLNPNSEYAIYDQYRDGAVKVKNQFEYRTAEDARTRFANLNFTNANLNPEAALVSAVKATINPLYEKILSPDRIHDKGYAITAKGEPSPFSGTFNKKVKREPEAAKEAKKRQSETPFKVNMDALALFKANPDMFLRTMGYKNLEDYKDSIPQVKESISSFNRQLIGQMEMVNEILEDMVRAGLKPEDAYLYFQNKTVANQRLMQVSSFNPQSGKVLREIFQPVAEPISTEEVRGMADENGNVELTEGYVIPVDVLEGFAKDWEHGIQLDSDRDLVGDINRVADILKADFENKTITETDAQTRNQRNLFMAMAQGLGIKVERMTEHNALYKLASKINTSLIQDMIAVQRAALNGEEVVTDEELASEFVKEFGNGTNRAFAAIRAITQYLYQPNGKFDSYLFYETDGITNGTSNYTAQDGTHSTDFLRSVGIFSGSFLLKQLASLQEKGIDVATLPADEVSRLVGGLAPVLENHAVQDTYEKIAKAINNVISQYNLNTRAEEYMLQTGKDTPPKYKEMMYKILSKGFIDSKTLFDLVNNNEIMAILEYDSKAPGTHIVDLINTMTKTFPQIAVRQPDAKLKFGNKEYSPIEVLQMPLKDFVENITSSISVTSIPRSVAKTPAQPLTYGGGTDGILNQLLGDWNSSLIDLIEKTRKLTAEGSPEAEKYQDLIEALRPTFEGEVVTEDMGDAYYMGKLANSIIKRGKQSVSDNVGKDTVTASKQVYEPLITARQVLTNFADTRVGQAYITLMEALGEWRVKNGEKKGLTEADPEWWLYPDAKEYSKLERKAYDRAGLTTALTNTNKFGRDLAKELNEVGDTIAANPNPNIVSPASTAQINGEHRTRTSLSFAQIKHIAAVGAKVLTDSLVSRETVVQDTVLKAMDRLGIRFLNVYDGLDALWEAAKLFSKVTNEAFFNAHADNNMSKEQYQSMITANIMENTIPTLDKDTVDAILTKAGFSVFADIDTEGVYAFKASVLEASKGFSLKVTPNELKALARHFKSSELLTPSVVQALESGNEIILDGSVLGKLIVFFGTEARNLFGKETGAYISNTLPELLPVLEYHESLRKLTDMREQGIKKEVMYKLWENDVPILIGTFGGTGTGSAINYNEKTVNNLLKLKEEFLAYKESNPKYPVGFNDFVLSKNHSLKDKVDKYKKEAEQAYPLPTAKEDILSLRDESVTTVGEIITDKTSKYFSERFNSFLVNWAKKLNLQDTKVYTDFNAFANEAKRQGYDLSGASAIDINGVALDGVGIFIHNKDHTPVLNTLNHELIHVIMQKALNNLFSMDEASKAFRRANPDFVATGQVLMSHIQDLAQTLKDETFLGNEVASILNLSAAKIATYNDKRVAILALAKKLQNPALDANEKYTAVQEILAYAFTEDNLVSRIANTSNAKTRGSSVWQKLSSKLKRALSNLRNSFMQLWFGKDVKGKDSLFGDMLAAMYKLTEQAEQTDNTGNINPALFSANRNPAKDFVQDLMNRLSANPAFNSFINQAQPSANKVIFALSGDLVQALRNKGMTIDPIQERGIAMLSNVYQSLMDTDSKFSTLANSILSDIYNSEDLENTIPPQVFEVMKDKVRGNTAQTLALLTVLDETGLISNLAETDEGFLNRVGKSIEDFLAGNSKGKASFEDQIRFLAQTAVDYDYANTSYFNFNNDALKEAMKDYDDRLNIADNVSNLASKLPTDFATLLNGIMSDWAMMPLEGRDNTDSLFGKLLQTYLEERIKDKGRIDTVGRLIRLFIQQRHDTKGIYAMRAAFASTLEQVRERNRKSVPNVIHAAFLQEGVKINAKTDKVIADSLFRTSAYNIFNANPANFKELLEDSTKRKDKYDDLRLDLANELAKLGLQPELENFIHWQAQGLADLQINRTAKAFDSSVPSHFILPNARAIASIPLDKSYRNGKSKKELIDALSPIIEQMVAVKSLDNVLNANPEAAKEMAELSQYKAFRTMMHQAYDINHMGDKYDLNGTEGIVMNKRNPNQDMQVVRVGSKSYDELVDIGYRELKTVDWLGKEYSVMFTDTNPITGYQTGSFGFADDTNFGTNINTGESLRSVATYVNDPNINMEKTMQNVFKASLYDSNFYDEMTEVSHVKPLVYGDGSFRGISLEVDSATVENTFQTTEEGISALGNLQGRYFEQEYTAKVNAKNARELINMYQSTNRKSEWMILDGKVKPKSNKPADVQYANTLNDFYSKLPDSTKAEFHHLGGLPIRKSEVDNIVGYNRIDIMNLYTGKSTLPNNVQQTIRDVLGAFGVNKDTLKYLKTAQDAWAGTVGYMKELILIRSIAVPVQNMVSNVIHLANWNIPLKQIRDRTRVGIAEAKKYTNNRIKLAELYVQMRDPSLSTNKRNILEAQVKHLSDALNNSPIHPLVEAGMFSNISSAAGYEQQGLDKDFTFRNTFKQKLGIEELMEDFDNSGIGRAVNNILISEGSDTFAFMEKSLDYGDFVAKFVLYDHLTKDKGLKSKEALSITLEEFVNYSMNRGALFDYANAMGLTWFMSYATGIQKVIWKMARRQTRRTAAVYGLGKVTGFTTVPMGNPLDKSWDYATSPSNILDGVESHYLHKVFSWF